MRVKMIVAVLFVLALPTTLRAAVIIYDNVQPGSSWAPLGDPNSTPSGSSFVYATSFRLPGPEYTRVTSLGIYAKLYSETLSTTFRFELWSDTGSFRPNPDAVLGVTEYRQVSDYVFWHVVTAPLITPVDLQRFTRYWLIASVVGQTPTGGVRVGACDIGYCDGTFERTFIYSNDPTGRIFDDTLRLPAMSIYVEAVAVPEPSAWMILAGGLALLGLKRRCET